MSSGPQNPVMKNAKLTDATPNTRKAFENRAKRSGMINETDIPKRVSHTSTDANTKDFNKISHATRRIGARENVDPFTGL